MKKFIIITVSTFLMFHSAAFGSDEKAPHWTYEGAAGPAHWGSLSEKFAACDAGLTQSPIDISKENGTTSAIRTDYKGTNLDLVNNGHTIQLNYSGGSKLYSDGQEYDLLQLHFHAPSEHTVNGHHYPLEMHLVHKAANGSLAVVAVMFEEGAENAELAKIWKNIPAHAHGVFKSDAKVTAAGLLPAHQTYTKYSGSLTTPPCSEGVAWHVLTTPMQLSKDQIKAFRAIIHDNNRPIQPLNGRQLIEGADGK